jgi:hypothetical protein
VPLPRQSRTPSILAFTWVLACTMALMTNVDYCEVMATTVDYDMAITTLDNLYYVLSCRPTPPNVLSVQYGCHADSGGIEAFLGPHVHQEWVLKRFGPRLLVGFWCENTCHVGSPDLSSSLNRTCPWNLARGEPSASLLEELAPGRMWVPPRIGPEQTVWLGTKGTPVPGY